MAEATDQLDFVDLLSQFRCLGTTDHETLVQQLHSLLDGTITREQCAFILEMSSWNLQSAVGIYYDYFHQQQLLLDHPLEMRVDGCRIDPSGHITTGQQCYITWTVHNTGRTPWPPEVRLIFCSGHHFEGIIEGPIGGLLPQGKKDIAVTINAPSVPGVYHSQWRLCNIDGKFFGDVLRLSIKIYEPGGVATITEQLSAMTTESSYEQSRVSPPVTMVTTGQPLRTSDSMELPDSDT